VIAGATRKFAPNTAEGDEPKKSLAKKGEETPGGNPQVLNLRAGLLRLTDGQDT